MLKNWFRIRNKFKLTTDRSDAKLPLEKFSEKMIQKFNVKNLSETAQKLYDQIVTEKMHMGDPITLINLMFEQFEKPELRAPPGSTANYT